MAPPPRSPNKDPSPASIPEAIPEQTVIKRPLETLVQRKRSMIADALKIAQHAHDKRDDKSEK